MHLSLASRTAIGLPLKSGGSTPAAPFSRPAQRSLTFRPARLLSCSTQPVVTGVLQTMSLPPCPAPAATNRKRQLLGGFRTHQENAPFHGALIVRASPDAPLIAVTLYERERASHLATKRTTWPIQRPGWNKVPVKPFIEHINKESSLCFSSSTIQSLNRDRRGTPGPLQILVKPRILGEPLDADRVRSSVRTFRLPSQGAHGCDPSAAA